MFIIYFFYTKLYNLFFLIITFLLEIFFDNYNLMKRNIFTLVPTKKNIFDGQKYYLTNLPFNLKNTKEFKFNENITITNDVNNTSKNNILIVNVNNLHKFTNIYFKYDEYDIFYEIDKFKLKKNFGGIFFINENLFKNIFQYKYIWFFSESNFSGYIFNNKLIY